MMKIALSRLPTAFPSLVAASFIIGAVGSAQPPQGEPPMPPPGGFPGGGPGGPPMRREPLKVLERFDANKNGVLDADERTKARAFIKEERSKNAGEGGGPPRFGRGRENSEPAKPGAKVSPKDVKNYPDAPLYDTNILRTFFLDFDGADWENELVDFHDTDVEVPATLTVDGKQYKGVGIRFRGASSYFMVSNGYKRSMNVSVDYTDSKQRLGGYKTLNLLNEHEDATFLHSVLYSTIARNYLPAPKVNLIKLVINGENWGIYNNAEQFNKDFLKEWFKDTKGTRWKVPGSPFGGGGLIYKGDDVKEYERLYEIKNDDEKEAAKGWRDLINLCAVLDKTPADELEKALEPILDIDNVLRFLAIENVLMNGDGYWIRASDFSIFEDHKGVFRMFPHDMNECFSLGGGPGFGPGGRGGRRGSRGGPGGNPGGNPGGTPPGETGNGAPPPPQTPPNGETSASRTDVPSVEPLVGLTDPSKPLLSKLLAVPKFKNRYLGYVKQIATDSLDWAKLGPVVKQLSGLIDAEVNADTKKLSSYEAFQIGVGLKEPKKEELTNNPPPQPDGRQMPERRSISLRQFIEKRREFLLQHASLKDIKVEPSPAKPPKKS